MFNTIIRYGHKMLWHTLPPSCLLCHAAIPYHPQHPNICLGCENDLLSNDRACPRCAEPEPIGALCRHCQQHTPAYHHTTAAFVYTPPLAHIITQYKYGKQPALAKPLTKLMLSQALPPALARDQIDALIAVPMHPKRLQQRGFNQAHLLALQLGRLFNLPVLTPHVQRLSAPLYQQAMLDRQARFLNMQGVFSTDKSWANLHVLVIDDVMTTGATIHALASILKENGAKQVDAWVFARTPA